MTPIDGTTAVTGEHDSAWLVWVTVLTGLTTVIAVVVLSLTHHADAVAAVSGIGSTSTAIGWAQITARSRR
ncbi:hypothetical protein [Streptomyces sp. 1222.5]|uniref:hypothetical protein n=1 Tax=Streptomyces sp. 1222.5 TaxID=1881026 RepID=UPI003EBDE2B9